MSHIPSIASVLDRLWERAPLERAASWDTVGLQLGDPTRPATRVGVCHEVTDGVATTAIEEGVDLLISYHPLLFVPIDRVVAGTGVAGRVLRLAEQRIAVAVAHTNWDVAPGGAADALAGALGLETVQPWAPLWGEGHVKVITYVPHDHAEAVRRAMADAGAGVIGGYTGCAFASAGVGSFTPPEGASPFVGAPGSAHEEPETRLEMVAPASAVGRVAAALVAAHPYEEPAWDVVERRGDAGFAGRIGRLAKPMPLERFVARTSAALTTRCRHAGDGARMIETAAVIPGSGGDLISAAASAGADVVVTGDVRHHQARAALDRSMAVVDAGHAATERPGVANLYAAVAEIAPTVSDLGRPDPDPWRSQ